MFLLALFTMAAAAGFFESITVSTNSITIVNSPIAINGILNELNLFIYFFLPSLIGGTISRDFKYDVHSLMYSYSFKKWEYMVAKFFAGITVTIMLVLVTALAIILATFLPGTNPNLLGPFRLEAYVQSFSVFVLPNLFFYGAIVLAVVIATRNVSVGFILVLALLIIQSMAQVLTVDLDNKMLSALLDPFGSQALSYYTEYWTVYEQNENTLPLGSIVWYNRALWFGIGSLIFSAIYFLFGFNQQPISFNLFKKQTPQRFSKSNFGSIVSIDLPKVEYDNGFIQNFKRSWSISKIDFKYIVKGWSFIIISILGILISLLTISVGGEIFGTDTLPVTWQMLELPGTFFSLFINLLTFLYAGILLHRSRNYNMDQLIHTTTIPDWVIYLSKFFALVKMQVLLLGTIMFVGIGVQIYSQFYNFEIGLYLFDLYAIKLIHVIIWGLFSFFIHSFFKNYFSGFFILLLVSSSSIFLITTIGIEDPLYLFNLNIPTRYSDMNGYGHFLEAYYTYKLYWLFLVIALSVFSITYFRRGLPESIKERFTEIKYRANPILRSIFILSLIGFIALGSFIWYISNVKYERLSSKEQEASLAQWEINYGKFKNIPQPRIVSTYVELDLYPETRDFKASGTYTLKNKTSVPIDSIHIDHGSFEYTFTFDSDYVLAMEDDSMNYDIYQLTNPLQPRDSIKFDFTVANEPNEFLKNNSPIRANGTFINNSIFPRIGYNKEGELRGKESREKFGLPPRERMMPQTDSASLMNNYISYDSDWMDFETIISTSPDQIAIAPGYLQKEWIENGRRYFHYKMDSPILNFYSYISAEFEVEKDSWNDVAIEIYYHKGHDYNVDRMIRSIKSSLDYYTANFSPYQHKQVRIIEFPRTSGSFAQSYANTIPYSESVGFIADVDETNEDGVDYPFSITSHEIAHQWWAHQVIGANVQGATVMSESLSEYSSLKVLEKEYGADQMRVFLKDALDKYLTGRTLESMKEKPLIYNENQQYIHYNKGSLVLYALSDYIGEDIFNQALGRYIKNLAFQEAPYTTATEFKNYLAEVTPDSLQYLITDMFETITLYENSIVEAEFEEKEEDNYEVTLVTRTMKYKTDDQGKRIYKNDFGDSLYVKIEGRRTPLRSYPLSDWIEVGVFGTDDEGEEKVLYLEKLKFDTIQDTLSITVNEMPTSVGVDPYNKLIDIVSDDNRRVPRKKETVGLE
jgi:ABC-2 type transport system permease protein